MSEAELDGAQRAIADLDKVRAQRDRLREACREWIAVRMVMPGPTEATWDLVRRTQIAIAACE